MKAQFFILSLCLLGILSYDPGSAVSYAYNYCDKRNPDFNDYTGQGGDCANFVSQCLLAGGQDLSGCSVDDRGCVINVGALESCLMSKGWNYAESESVPDGFGAGGVITINNSGHAIIAVTSDTFAAHTNDRCGVGFPGGVKKFFWP